MDLDVPKFDCYVPGNRLDDDQARALFKDTLASRQSFSDVGAMDAGVSTKGLRVAGVPIGDDANILKPWDQQCPVYAYDESYRQA